LYVKTSESDVTKVTIQEWEDEFIAEPLHFFIVNSNEVQESIIDFINYKEVDVLTMLPYKEVLKVFLIQLDKKIATHFDIPILTIPIA
jgi:hypothetical protein